MVAATALKEDAPVDLPDAAAVAAIAQAALQQQQQQQVPLPQQPLEVPPVPKPLPLGWVVKESRSQPGYDYYFHQETGVSTWQAPAAVNDTAAADERDTVPKNESTSRKRVEKEEDSAAAAHETAVKLEDDADATSRKRSRPKEERSAGSSKRVKSESSSDKPPKQVRALHILRKHKDVRRPSSWRESKITKTKDEARQELQELLDVLQEEAAGGNIDNLRATFEELARTESDCSSHKRGGDLGTFGRKKMQQPFEDAAFALKVGEMTKAIVETNSGLHIILRIA